MNGGEKLKVLLVNGSPHASGCVFAALSEAARALEQCGVTTEIFHIGTAAVQGCTACFKCVGSGECVFRDKAYIGMVERIKDCDGIIIGAPVYYAGPPGSLCSLLDRVFFASGRYLKYKPGACVVNCRRGGASAAFDRLNKYFTINRMPVVSSQYWNSTHGSTPEELAMDLEGLQTMRTLGVNMAHMLRAAVKAALPLPEEEPVQRTNFI